ncbi:hypothetical protein D1007_07195 [Hordeum vulgare]|nr:hypothetical protein D1007_07195 [Hordeum vulgare]
MFRGGRRGRAAAAAGAQRKSARNKSAFAYIVAAKDNEVVEARRPATTRDAHRRHHLATKLEEPAPEEETGKPSARWTRAADEFINKFTTS